jgi:hypothetical protein
LAEKLGVGNDIDINVGLVVVVDVVDHVDRHLLGLEVEVLEVTVVALGDLVLDH